MFTSIIIVEGFVLYTRSPCACSADISPVLSGSGGQIRRNDLYHPVWPVPYQRLTNLTAGAGHQHEFQRS